MDRMNQCMRIEPVTSCPLCAARDRRFLVGRWSDPIGVARCVPCGFVHTTGLSKPTYTAPEPDALRTFAHYDRLLEGRLRGASSSSRVLHVLSHSDALMNAFASQRFETHVVPRDGKHCQHRLHAVDPTDPGSNIGHRFEVVVLRNALSTSTRPAALLHFVQRHLCEGGVVIIDEARWGRRALRRRLNAGVVGLFDSTTTQTAIEAAGMRRLVSDAPSKSRLGKLFDVLQGNDRFVFVAHRSTHAVH